MPENKCYIISGHKFERLGQHSLTISECTIRSEINLSGRKKMLITLMHISSTNMQQVFLTYHQMTITSFYMIFLQL